MGSWTNLDCSLPWVSGPGCCSWHHSQTRCRGLQSTSQWGISRVKNELISNSYEEQTSTYYKTTGWLSYELSSSYIRHQDVSLKGLIPLLSFGESLCHLFAARLSSALCFPSPVSQACVDISATDNKSQPTTISNNPLNLKYCFYCHLVAAPKTWTN